MATRDPWGAFKNEAIALTAEALHAAYGVTESIDHLLEEPDPELADFAFPCYAFAQELGDAPANIAKDLEDALPPRNDLRITPSGPYLNFTVAPQPLVETTLTAIQDHQDEYGHAEETGKRVLVEHTSANPTGPLHVGRARNPLLADTLVRIMRAAGHDVTAEYYVNDMGRQAATLVWGAQAFQDAIDDQADKEDHRLVTAYQAASQAAEEDESLEAEISKRLQAFEDGDEDTATEFREVVTRAMTGIRATLERAHVHHDNVKFESELVLDGTVDEVLERLKKLDACGQEDDGAYFLDMQALGVDSEKPQMFLTRSDGTTLYGTRDIAYHMDKFGRADGLVDVLGEDHKLHVREVQASLEALGEDGEMDVVFYNFVSLPEGSMSTRAGRVVYLDDLLDEAILRAREEVRKRRGEELTEEDIQRVAEQVGIGALRFNIAQVQAEKPIEFRWEDALSFEGATAPFVQYSHARTCGILDKAGLDPATGKLGDPTVLEHEAELALVRTLARLPGIVKGCAHDRQVHPIAAYAVQAASDFNDFYRDCPVLQADNEALYTARLGLVDASRQVLANALTLLGIEAPASM